MKNECKYGFIEWREPNLEEGLQLMEAFQELGNEGAYSSLVKYLDLIFPLFSKIEIKIGKKKLKTLDDFKSVSKIAIMTMLMEIKTATYNSMFDLEEEKKS